MFRTYKNQLKDLKMDLPSNVKTTRDLQVFCDKRRIKMNSQALYSGNQGLTPDEARRQLKESTVVEPEILLARSGTKFPEIEAVEKIKIYQRDVRFAQPSQRIGDSDMLEKIQITNITTQHMVEEQSSQIKAISENVTKVLDRVTPKKRITNKAQILRDPVPKSMLERILNAPKPKHVHNLSWARFQMTATILFFTGLRISEVAPVTQEMIQEVVEQGKLTFYQPKVNKHRTIRFTSHGINTIKKVFNKTKKVIFDKNEVLFPLPESNRKNVEKFTASINKLLRLFNDDDSKKISSHSFRVAFVSNALKHTSAHNTQILVGHADIRSTMKYSRHELEQKEEKGILTKMFDEDKEGI